MAAGVVVRTDGARPRGTDDARPRGTDDARPRGKQVLEQLEREDRDRFFMEPVSVEYASAHISA